MVPAVVLRIKLTFGVDEWLNRDAVVEENGVEKKKTSLKDANDVQCG